MLKFIVFILSFNVWINSCAATSLRLVQSESGVPIQDIYNHSKICAQQYEYGFSVECVVSNEESEVTFLVNGQVVREEKAKPFMLAGDLDGVIFPWHSFPWGDSTIECRTSGHSVFVHVHIGCADENKEAIEDKELTEMAALHSRNVPAPTNEISKDYCVTRKGTDYVGDLIAPDWTASGTAVTYKAENYSHAVDPPGTSILLYEFTVPVASNYAVVLDMHTRHWTEHNDVWVSCEHGLVLRRGIRRSTAEGPVKAYHNSNGRAKEAFSKDYDPHSISTLRTLVPGTNYACRIGGRSTRTTIHALILFPCEGLDCRAESEHWKNYLSTCVVE